MTGTFKSIPFKWKAALLAILITMSHDGLAQRIAVTCDEWPPYIEQNPQIKGIVWTLLNEAFESASIEIDWELLPWSRAMALARVGKKAGVACAWYSDERNQDFAYSEPYLVNRLSMIKLKGLEIRWQTLRDLQDYQFAQVRGAVVSKAFDEAKFIKKAMTPSTSDALRLVLYARADLYADDEANIMATLRKDYPDFESKVEFVERPISANKLYFISSRKRSDHLRLINTFNTGLKHLKASGRYTEILENYGMDRLAIP